MCSCLLYLFCRPTDLAPRWLRVCLHTCICASSQPCTAPATNFQEEITEWNLMCFIWKDFACQLYTASLLSAVNTTAAWQRSERGWQLLNLLAPRPLTCSEQLSVADIHFPGKKNPFHSLPIPHSPPFWSRTWSSYTLLIQLAFAGTQTRQQWVLHCDPFLFPLIQQHWWTT